MVRTFLEVYGARLLFLFLQEQIKDIIIITAPPGPSSSSPGQAAPLSHVSWGNISQLPQCGWTAGGCPAMAETRTKKAFYPHTFRHVYSHTKFEDARRLCVCAVGLLWTNAAKVILNKSCQYGKGRTDHAPGANTPGKWNGQKNVRDHQSGPMATPAGGYGRRPSSSVSRVDRPRYALPLPGVYSHAVRVLSSLARTFARCVCRAAPGNEGQPGVPVPSDCWRPCTAAL
jgi:hypothetical protein